MKFGKRMSARRQTRNTARGMRSDKILDDITGIIHPGKRSKLHSCTFA
ncbi:unnamed protein product [Amoebophrya sp. A120]|nr:unnamed protein product [Amoebophrya sp. A120]|eukprot:GSA120T00018990001.1